MVDWDQRAALRVCEPGVAAGYETRLTNHIRIEQGGGLVIVVLDKDVA